MSYQQGAQIGNTLMNFGRTAMMFQDFQGRQEDRAFKLKERESNKKAYELAGLLAKPQTGGMQQVEGRMPGAAEKGGMSNMAINMPEGSNPPGVDSSQYSDKEWVDGHALYQKSQLNDFQIKQKEYDLSDAGRKEKVSKIATRMMVSDDKLRSFQSLKTSGASKINQGRAAAELINLLPNGINTKVISGSEEEGNFQLKVINWSGEEEIVDINEGNIDPYLAKADQMFAAHFGETPQKRFEITASGEQMRRNRNGEILQEAITDEKALYKDSNGNIWYRVRAGLTDPQTGDMMPSFYTDGVNSDKRVFEGSDEAKKLNLSPGSEISRKASARKAGLDYRGKMATVEKIETEVKDLKEGRMPRKEQQAHNAKRVVQVDKKMKSWIDVNYNNATPEKQKIQRNIYANEYDMEVLGKEKAQPLIRKRVVRTGTDETGQKVYANASGEMFTDKACTKPYKEKENRNSRLADGSLQRFKINR